MQKVTPVMGKIAYLSHTFRTADKDISKHQEGPTIERVREMAKETMVEDLALLTYEDGTITIPHSGVYIQKEKEYSDDYSESSKTYETRLRTYCTVTKREIFTNVKTHKNPGFDGNPECEFCYKKVVGVTEDHLLDEAKTKKMVCSGCKKELRKMRKIVEEIRAR